MNDTYLDKLQFEARAMNQQIQTLESRCQALQDELQSRTSIFQNREIEFKNHIQRLEQELNRHSQQNQLQERQIHQMEAHAKAEIERVHDQITQFQAQAEKRMQQLQEELAHRTALLERTTSELQQRKIELTQVTKNFEMTSSQQQRSIQELTNKLAQGEMQANQQIQLYNEQIHSFQQTAERKLQMLQEELTAKTGMLERTNIDLAQKKAEIQQMNKNFENMSSQYQKKLLELTQQLQTIQIQFDKEQNMNGKMKEDLRIQINTLHKDLQMQQQSSTQYAQAIAQEQNQLKANIMEAQKQLGMKSQELLDVKQRLEGQIKELKILTTRLGTELEVKSQALAVTEAQFKQFKMQTQQQHDQMIRQFEERQKEIQNQQHLHQQKTVQQSQLVVQSTIEDHKKEIEHLDQFWSEKYKILSQNSQKEIQRLGLEFHTQLEECERRHEERLALQEHQHQAQLRDQEMHYSQKVGALSDQINKGQAEREELRIEIGRMQTVLRDAEQRIRELNFQGSTQNEQAQIQIMGLQNSKEELLNYINCKQLEHDQRVFQLKQQIEDVFTQNGLLGKEINMMRMQTASLQEELSQQRAAYEQRDQEVLRNRLQLEGEVKYLEQECSRLEGLFKQALSELKIQTEQMEDIRIIDDYTIKERDLEIIRLKSLEMELKSKNSQLQKHLNELEVNTALETKQLQQQLNDLTNDNQVMKMRFNILSQSLAEEKGRYAMATLAQEQEIANWQERYKQQVKENETLANQLLESQQAIQQKQQVQLELDNLRQQFELMTQQYNKMHQEAYEVCATKDEAKQMHIQQIQEFYSQKLEQLKIELQQQIDQQKTVKHQTDRHVFDLTVEVQTLSDQIRIKNGEINNLRLQLAGVSAQKDQELFKIKEQLIEMSNSKTEADSSQGFKALLQKRDEYIADLEHQLEVREESLRLVQQQANLIKQLQSQLSGQNSGVKSVQPKPRAVSQSYTDTIKPSQFKPKLRDSQDAVHKRLDFSQTGMAEELQHLRAQAEQLARQNQELWQMVQEKNQGESRLEVLENDNKFQSQLIRQLKVELGNRDGKFKSSIEELYKEIEAKSNEIQQLQRQVSAKEESKLAYVGQIKNSNTSNQQLQSQLTQLQQMYEKLQKENNQLLRGQGMRASGSLSNRDSNYASQKEQSQQQGIIYQQREQIRQLELQVQMQAKQLEENIGLLEELGRKQSGDGEAEMLRERLESCNREVQDKEHRINLMQNEIDTLQLKLLSYEQRLDSIQQESASRPLKQSEDQRGLIQRLQEELKHKESQNLELTQRYINDMNEHSEMLAIRNEENRRLREMLESTSTEQLSFQQPKK